MKIFTELTNEQSLALPDNIEQLIEDCAKGALEEEAISDDAELSVTFTDNENIRILNNEYRNIDRETDVLSFPLGDENGFEVNPDNDAILLGDIVISVEKAMAQSEEYGHSFRREVAFLLTHSLFHLLGYDHITPEEEKEMFAKQEQVLNKLGITR